VRASAAENPELLWALRGGGGNFGVVTSFEYALHDVGPTVFGGAVFYPGEEAAAVLRGFREAVRDAPDALTTVVNLTTAPPAPFLPESVHGKPVIGVFGLWSGDPAEGNAATRPLRELGAVVADLFGELPYTAMQSLIDPLYPRGLVNYFRSAFFDALDDPTIDALCSAYENVPNRLCELHLHHLGGAMRRTPGGGTAFATRDNEFILNVISRSPDRADYDGIVSWARAACDAIGPDAPAYVNFTGEASEDRVRASYPPETYTRLVAVKDRYDPENLFRLNQNIPPSEASGT
jgi:FAD/FMN-containing dehydrogenase